MDKKLVLQFVNIQNFSLNRMRQLPQVIQAKLFVDSVLGTTLVMYDS